MTPENVIHAYSDMVYRIAPESFSEVRQRKEKYRESNLL